MDDHDPVKPPHRAATEPVPQLTPLNADEEEDDGEFSSRSASPEGAATPTFADVKKSLSFKSLRDLELSTMHKRAWRRPGERKQWPRTLEQLVVFSTRGGIRAFLTAYTLRATINVVVVLFRLLRTSRVKTALIHQALFGPDNFRFGGMMGSFVFLFKWTLHGLRLYNPGARGKGKSESWHAAAAGAVSAISLLAEKPSRRITYAQQLFVRGLQGSYNMLHARGRVHIPNGDVLLFGLSCAQIMYAWLMAPESLPPGYLRWITNASRVAPPSLPINLSRYRKTPFPFPEAQKVLARKDITPTNKFFVENYIANAERGLLGPPHAPCELVHPWIDSCKVVPFERWQSVWRWIFPVYAALHTIPPIVLRQKVFRADPYRVLLRSATGTIRSCSFLASFVTIFQTLVCVHRNLFDKYGHSMPDWMHKMLLHRFYYWAIGFSTCIPLFIEEKKRRGELAMYVLPKALESIWSIARRRSYVPFVPGGEVILLAAGLGQVMAAYTHDPKRLSGLVRSVLYQFVGPS